MKALPTLVWDIDDVLNRLTHAWLEQAWLPAHPESRVVYADLIANPPHEALGVSLSEYLVSLDAFRASPVGRELNPTVESLTWFRRHGYRYRHVALTARPLTSAPDAASWVLRHYGRWIRAYGFVPSPRLGENLPAYHTTKADWLEWLHAGDALIDDSLANLNGAGSLGLATVIVPQPWNNATGSLADALESILERVPSPA